MRRVAAAAQPSSIVMLPVIRVSTSLNASSYSRHFADVRAVRDARWRRSNSMLVLNLGRRGYRMPACCAIHVSVALWWQYWSIHALVRPFLCPIATTPHLPPTAFLVVFIFTPTPHCPPSQATTSPPLRYRWCLPADRCFDVHYYAPHDALVSILWSVTGCCRLRDIMGRDDVNRWRSGDVICGVNVIAVPRRRRTAPYIASCHAGDTIALPTYLYLHRWQQRTRLPHVLINVALGNLCWIVVPLLTTAAVFYAARIASSIDRTLQSIIVVVRAGGSRRCTRDALISLRNALSYCCTALPQRACQQHARRLLRCCWFCRPAQRWFTDTAFSVRNLHYLLCLLPLATAISTPYAIRLFHRVSRVAPVATFSRWYHC